MAPGSLVIGLAVFSSCYLAHSSVVGRYEYRNPAILCCSSACRWSLEIYPCRYHPAKSKETCLYSGPGVLSTLCRYVSCPSATVYCCNVFLSVMKKNAKKAVKPFACGSLGRSALRIAAIGSLYCFGRSWPGARVRRSARKRPHDAHHGAHVRPHRPGQISICSEISSASSTSIPRYLTVLSSLVWPSRSWTALRFLVRL